MLHDSSGAAQAAHGGFRGKTVMRTHCGERCDIVRWAKSEFWREKDRLTLRSFIGCASNAKEVAYWANMPSKDNAHPQGHVLSQYLP